MIVLAAVGAAVLTRWGPAQQSDPSYFQVPRESRAYVGSVFRAGVAAPGISVHLLENVIDGARFSTTTDASGRFQLEWRPTRTHLRQKLVLLAELPDVPKPAATGPSTGVVQKARAGENRIDLAPAVSWSGRTSGGSSVGVVWAGTRGSGAVTEGAGHLPRSAPAVVLGLADGCAPRWQTMRAHADETEFVLRLRAGVDVSITARDPFGKPIVGAVARLAGTTDIAAALPQFQTDEGGVAVLKHQSDGDYISVRMEAEGYLPVRAGAWPGLDNEVILWPARTVEVTVWDAWNQRGIDNAGFDVELSEERKGRWLGRKLGSTSRPILMAPGKTVGTFRLLLPQCALELTANATGYSTETASIGANDAQARIRLTPPRRRHRAAHLVLIAPDQVGDLPLVLTADDGEWGRRARLKGGRARILVKPNTKLKFASTRADGGQWIAQTSVEPVAPGKEREVQVALLPAIALTVRTNPPVTGTVYLSDAAYEDTSNAESRPLIDGRATFAARPLRVMRVRVVPDGNYFEERAEFVTADTDEERGIDLISAAGFETTVREFESGLPVSFARVRVWEPTANGRLELRLPPRVSFADANGVVRVVGLRRGEMAYEIDAPYLTVHRGGVVRLDEGVVKKLPGVTLPPQSRWSGMVVDELGHRQVGKKLAVMRPEVYRLKFANGGERRLFNLTSIALPTACADRDGNFSVPDPWVPDTDIAALKVGRESLLVVLSEGSSKFAHTVITARNLAENDGKAAIGEGGRVQIFLNGRVNGVYLLLPGGVNAVLLRGDPSMTVRPLPVHLPGGTHTLHVQMRDGRQATTTLNCPPGEIVDWHAFP